MFHNNFILVFVVSRSICLRTEEVIAEVWKVSGNGVFMRTGHSFFFFVSTQISCRRRDLLRTHTGWNKNSVHLLVSDDYFCFTDYRVRIGCFCRKRRTNQRDMRQNSVDKRKFHFVNKQETGLNTRICFLSHVFIAWLSGWTIAKHWLIEVDESSYIRDIKFAWLRPFWAKLNRRASWWAWYF